MWLTRATISTKQFFTPFENVFANKSNEEKKKLSTSLCTLFIHFQYAPRVSLSLSLFYHTRTARTTMQTILFSFLVGQPYGFWLIQLCESKTRNSLKLTFSPNICQETEMMLKKKWIQTQWWLQICKFANEKLRRNKKHREPWPISKPFIIQILENF